MKTVEEKQTVNFELKEAFVLWKKTSVNGLVYFKGNTEDKKTKLIAYTNTMKTNPEQPDIRVYVLDSEGNKGIEVASLWENIGRESGKRYLNGKTNENENLRGFYAKEDDDKKPYIRVYYR